MGIHVRRTSRLDFGVKRGERFEGMRIPTFEEILKKFACHCIMNIHLKTKGVWSDDPEETQKFLDMEIDVKLTYDYHRISMIVGQRSKHTTY